MPFFVIGLIITIFGLVFYRMTKKAGDKHGSVGSIIFVFVGLILMLIFGLFYRSFLL